MHLSCRICQSILALPQPTSVVLSGLPVQQVRPLATQLSMLAHWKCSNCRVRMHHRSSGPGRDRDRVMMHHRSSGPGRDRDHVMLHDRSSCDATMTGVRVPWLCALSRGVGSPRHHDAIGPAEPAAPSGAPGRGRSSCDATMTGVRVPWLCALSRGVESPRRHDAIGPAEPAAPSGALGLGWGLGWGLGLGLGRAERHHGECTWVNGQTHGGQTAAVRGDGQCCVLQEKLVMLLRCAAHD